MYKNGIEIRRDEGIGSFAGYSLTDDDGNPAEYDTPQEPLIQSQYDDFFAGLQEGMNSNV
jgi:hypothetical protein